MKFDGYLEIIPNNLYLKTIDHENYESIHMKRENFPTQNFVEEICSMVQKIDLKKKTGVKTIHESTLEELLRGFSPKNLEILRDKNEVSKLILAYQREIFNNVIPSEEWIKVQLGTLPKHFTEEIETLPNEDKNQVYLDYMFDSYEYNNTGIINTEFDLYLYDKTLPKIEDIDFLKKYNVLESNLFFIDGFYSQPRKNIHEDVKKISDILRTENIMQIEKEPVYELISIAESLRYILNDPSIDNPVDFE